MSLTIWRKGIEFVGSTAGGTTATLPAHEAGDTIIAFSFRRGHATPPSLPSGWTTVGTGTGSDGSTSISARLAYRVATAAGTASGTWTNATHTVFVIYRYATTPTVQAAWMDGGGGATITYDSLYGTLSRSWALSFGAHASSDGDLTKFFSYHRWSARENETDPGAIAAGDTNGPTGGGTSGGVMYGSDFTADSWITVRVELGALYTTGSEFTAYTVPARTRSFARSPERTAGGSVRVLGDHLEAPSELPVRVHVPGTTLASAMSDAYDLVTLAEVAGGVSTHEGTFSVNGILGYAIEPVGSDALVTLRFAPTSSIFSAPGFILAPHGTITATGLTPTIPSGVGANAVTYDAAQVTHDGTAVTYGGA